MQRHDLLEKRLGRFTRLLQRVEKGDGDAVHPARVMSRRLRELLPLLHLDPGVSKKVGGRLRKLTRRLGKLRNLDVMLRLTDQLDESDRVARQALARVRNDIRRTRDKARLVLLRKKVGADFHRLTRRLEGVVDTLNESKDAAARDREMRWAVKARVAHRAATVRSAITDAGAVYLPERLHAVRVCLKKLRYSVELGVETAAGCRLEDQRALEQAQDLLGRLHDLQTLVDHVRDLQGSLQQPDPRAWHELDVLVLSLERRCRRLHARYVRNRAALTSLCDRLGTRQAGAAGAAARRKAS